MRIAIFGANGRLGSELVRTLTKKHEVLAITRRECDLDLSDFPQISQCLGRLSPEVVINATAMNGIEQCRDNAFKAIHTNASAPAAMARACTIMNALFVHYSTDYVFSGDTLDLYENTPTQPWGLYGRTKLWGEEAAVFCAERHLVFRVSSLYGRDMTGVLQPIKQVLEGKGTKDNPVKVLHQFCSPTSTIAVAEATAYALLHHSQNHYEAPYGVFHIASEGGGVWKTDFTHDLLRSYFGANPHGGDWHIEEGQLAEPRPVRSVLNPRKFQDTFGFPLLDWRTDMRSFLKVLPSYHQLKVA